MATAFPTGGANTNILFQDNSKLYHEMNSYFKMGEDRVSANVDLELKRQGFLMIIEGMKKLNLLIARTQDQAQKAAFQNLMVQKQELCVKIEKYLNNLANPPMQHQPIANAVGGGGGNNQNENSQLKGAIADAIVREKPNIKWDDIAGLENAKQALKEAVILPIKHPEIFQGNRKPWKGILMYGPPGTGKTYLAKACATEADATFFSISAADLVSKYVGDTEKSIRSLFDMARENKPSIIFIDECDSLFGARGDGQQEASRRAITEFLVQMQGVGKDDQGVLVLGATNLPWALDAAVRRRFEKRIYISLPDDKAREYMFMKALEKDVKKGSLSDQDYSAFSQRTSGYSGSDISVVIKDALMQPVKLLQSTNKFQQVQLDNGEIRFMPMPPDAQGPAIQVMNFMQVPQGKLYIPQLSRDDILFAINKNKPSVSQANLVEYENFTKTFGQDG